MTAYEGNAFNSAQRAVAAAGENGQVNAIGNGLAAVAFALLEIAAQLKDVRRAVDEGLEASTSK